MTSLAEFSRRHLFSPNALSVLRGLIALSLPFLLLQKESVYHWAALVLFLLGALTDFLDGFLARSYGRESRFGKFMDPLMDKFLILIPLITFSYLGLYSMWWVVPIFLRELIVTFCRFGWMREGKVLGAEKMGKVKVTVQIVTLVFIFIYFLQSGASPEAGNRALYFLMMGMIVLTLVLTWISGISFLHRNREHFRSEAFAKYVAATGVGFMPIAPGTWGSALAVIFICLTQWSVWLYGLSFLALLGMGYWAVARIDLSGNKDPGFVVIDEVLGMWVTFIAIPLTIPSVIAGFLLFRIFDIIKPYPCRRLEKLPGYWGILCDDLAAGFYAWVILFIFFR